MHHQSTSRNQRPKGFNAKQAFLFALLLAVCIWLLYQLNHSHDKRKDYGASMRSKLSEEHGAMILGRRGNAGWPSTGGESDSLDRDLVGEGELKKHGSAGDDDLDRNIEEKTEEVYYYKDNGYGHGNVASHGEKKDEKDLEQQFEESQSNEDNNSDTQVREVELMSLVKDRYKEEDSHESAKGSMPDHDEQGDGKSTEKQVKEPQNAEKNHSSTLIQDKNQAVKENDEDKGAAKIEEKTVVQPGGMVNATVSSQSDMEDGVHGFHDETGVPQEIFEIIESLPKESSGYQKTLRNHLEFK